MMNAKDKQFWKDKTMKEILGKFPEGKTFSKEEVAEIVINIVDGVGQEIINQFKDKE